MAWNKCEVCGRNINGLANWIDHRDSHPEYMEIMRLKDLEISQRSIAGWEENMRLRDAYKAALAEGSLPPEVADLVRGTLMQGHYARDLEAIIARERERVATLEARGKGGRT